MSVQNIANLFFQFIILRIQDLKHGPIHQGLIDYKDMMS